MFSAPVICKGVVLRVWLKLSCVQVEFSVIVGVICCVPSVTLKGACMNVFGTLTMQEPVVPLMP